MRHNIHIHEYIIKEAQIVTVCLDKLGPQYFTQLEEKVPNWLDCLKLVISNPQLVIL